MRWFMMKMLKKVIGVSLFFAGFSLYAQTRDDITVYVPRPTANGGTEEHQSFFEENFKMEVAGAGYAVVESQNQADYTLLLTIQNNEFFEEYEGEEEFELIIQLMRNTDNSEVVRFSFPFTELESMYDWNLYLVYQAMANVPLTKLVDVPMTDHWRNKWLYIVGGGGLDIPWFLVESYTAKPSSSPVTGIGDDQASLAPIFFLGLEFQFLNFMSAEADAKFRFSSIEGTSNLFTPSLAVLLKFPIKPSLHFMLEPYAGVEFPMSTVKEVRFPLIAVTGGMQFGVRGGEMGAFFIDTAFTYDLGKTKTDNTYGVGSFQRFQVSIMVGYKLGFFNRIKDEEPVVE